MKYILIFIIIIVVSYMFREKFIEKYSNHTIIDKIYFINLDTSKDRLKTIMMEAKKNNLELERFPAINGLELDINTLYRQNIFTDFIFKTNKGMIGCTLSHIKLWQQIISRPEEYILILEDDVVFVDNFKDKFNYYYTQVPDNWDIIYLGASNIYGKKISKNIITPIYKGSHNLSNVGAYAMLVKKQTVLKLLNVMIPIRTDFDIQIKNYFNEYHNIYYFNPPIITHNNNMDSVRRKIDGKRPKAGYNWRNKLQSQVVTI